MKRIAAALLALLVAVVALPAAAQNPAAGAKHFTIFMVTFRGQTDVERGFKAYLAQRHMNVTLVERDIALDETKLPGIVAEIKRTKPDLVYTWGTQVTLGIFGRYDKADPKKNVTDIPGVFTLVASPLGAKIVPSLADSHRNITGVVHVVPTDVQVKAIESYRPFHKLGMIYTATAKNSQAIARQMRELGTKNDFTLAVQTFKDGPDKKPVPGDIPGMVRALKAGGAEWLYLPADTFLGEQIYGVLDAARKEHLPTFASTEQMMQAGALAGIVSHYYSVGQLTAYKAEQILVDGIPPSKIPTETLKRFSYVVTMPTARAEAFYPPVELFNYAEIVTKIKPPKKKKAV